MKYLLQQLDYPDRNLVSDIRSGFQVIGDLNRSHIFPNKLAPASVTEHELKKRAILSRKSITNKVQPSGSDENDSTLWNVTVQEMASGWLQGPFEPAEVTHLLGAESWNVTRRFMITQGGKPRIIDDGRESCVNAALTTHEKLVLMDIDSVANTLRAICNACSGDRTFSTSFMDGSTITNTVHSQWSDDLCWRGRTLDLKSAYKQLGYREDHLWAAVLVAYSPVEKKPKYFLSSALMFGSSSSVYSFNRLARAIWFLMTRYCLVLSHTFYDDFILIDPLKTSSSATIACEALLKILGWNFANEGKKYVPFGVSFDALGVNFDLSNMTAGNFIIKNKESRILELTATLKEYIEAGTISRSEAASLRGRLGFAQGQFLGHAMKPSLAVLSEFSSPLSVISREHGQLTIALEHLLQCVQNMAPRSISIGDVLDPILIFTDGASESREENETHSIGMFLFDTLHQTRIVMDGLVAKELIEAWRCCVGKQLIGQVELLPVVITKLLYRDLFKGRRCVYFIDNDSARECLIRGYSFSIASFSLVSLFFLVESQAPSFNWFARVPSYSNPADLPSRGKSSQACVDYNAKYNGSMTLDSRDLKFLLACLRTSNPT